MTRGPHPPYAPDQHAALLSSLLAGLAGRGRNDTAATPHYGPDSARLLVRLAKVDVDELTELVTESWRAAAPDDLGADG